MSIYLKYFTVPSVALFLLAAITARLPTVWDNYSALVIALPYVLFVACGCVAYFLLQYVYFYTALLFLSFYLLIQLHLKSTMAHPSILFAMLYGCIALPLLLMAVVLWGRKSPKSYKSIILMLGFASLIWLPYLLTEVDAAGFIAQIPVAFLTPLIHGTSLSIVMLVTAIPALFFLCLLYYLNPTLLQAHWIIGVVAIYSMLGLFSLPLISALTFSCYSALLLVALLQEAFELAYIDELTGIPGRKALEKQMLNLPRHYAIAMLDIDHFKKFNDRYGHNVGDQVLRMVAGKIAQVTGRGKAYRYGGEEFTIVFVNKKIDQVFDHLEQVRSEIESYSLQLRSDNRPDDDKLGKSERKGSAGQKVQVTISMGAASSVRSVLKPEDVIKLADKALYAAKKAGRNRIALHKPKAICAK